MRLITLIIMQIIWAIVTFTESVAEAPPPPLPIIDGSKSTESPHNPDKTKDTKSSSLFQVIKNVFGSNDKQDKTNIRKSDKNNIIKDENANDNPDPFLDRVNKLSKPDNKVPEQQPPLTNNSNQINQDKPASTPDGSNYNDAQPKITIDPDITKLLKDMSPNEDSDKTTDEILPEVDNKNSTEKLNPKDDKSSPLFNNSQQDIPAADGKLSAPTTAPNLPIPELPKKTLIEGDSKNPKLPLPPTMSPTPAQQQLITPSLPTSAPATTAPSTVTPLAPSTATNPTQQQQPIPPSLPTSAPATTAPSTVTPTVPAAVPGPDAARKTAVSLPKGTPENSKIDTVIEPLPANKKLNSERSVHSPTTSSTHQREETKNMHNEKKVTPHELSPEEALFVSDEAKILLLPDDDIILGKLSEQARIEQMDMHPYLKLFQESLDKARRADQETAIDNFIINYDLDSINNSKKDANEQQIDEAFEAIRKDNLFSLRALLDNYHLSQVIDQNGDTLLHASAWMDNYSLTKFLIMRGFNLTVFDFDQNTPLTLAEKEQNTDIVNLLRKAQPY